VGLEITYDGAAGSDIVVLTPTAGGPADKAGVKAGDVIVSVDGTPTKGLSLYDVSDLLQGEADSQVRYQQLTQTAELQCNSGPDGSSTGATTTTCAQQDSVLLANRLAVNRSTPAPYCSWKD
jgi:predicted metalloprotease with PDZ domain